MRALGPGIIGLGLYLPKEVRSNSYFYGPKHQGGLGLETDEKWILEKTGVRQRHIAGPDECVSHMAIHAARRALQMAGRNPKQVDKIILATTTPDYLMPTSSALVQTGLDPTQFTHAFDYGNVCNGGVGALELAYMMVGSGHYECVLVIGAEKYSPLLDYADRSTCTLFGDGAAAAVIASVDNPGPGSFSLHTDGSAAELITFTGTAVAGRSPVNFGEPRGKDFFFRMDGPRVYKHALRKMPEAAKEALAKAGVDKKAVTWVIPHQANINIINGVAAGLDLKGKGISYVSEMGNISAASIFAAMQMAFTDGWLQQGDILVLTGIGSGINWGAAVVQWNLENPTPRPGKTFVYRQA